MKLESSDKKIFVVDTEILKVFGTIQTMLQVLGTKDDDEEDETVPLPNVHSIILEKIIQWATYHRNDSPVPEETNKELSLDARISSWDADFLNVDHETLSQLLLAAHYLQIDGLIRVTSMTFAKMIASKTPEEIRQTFKLENDYTPEEEEQMKEEAEWCTRSTL